MQFEYKVISFRGRVETIDAGAVANQLSRLINDEANNGWEFYQINSVSIMVSPGCLASLFGAPSFPMTYDMAIFRRSSEKVPGRTIEDAAEERRLLKLKEEDQNSPIVIEKKRIAQPFINNVLGVGYKLISSKITETTEIWHFEVGATGDKFEIRSLDSLREFSKNFKPK